MGTRTRSKASRELTAGRQWKSWAWECLCLVVFLCLAGGQLFVYPITGLSDNNDFSKVLGPARVCKAAPENLNTYFVSSYDAGPKCQWDSGFVSTEILFVEVARYLSRPFTGRYRFDLRASAALHLAVLAGAFALMLSVSRRSGWLVRFLLPPAAVLIFTDVAYIAYLNSAYMDNASWVLLLLLVSLAATAWKSGASFAIAAAYALTGVLLIFSKAQHAPTGMAFAGLAVYYGWRAGAPGARKAWLAGGAAMLVSAFVMPALTPLEYRNISLYNLVFYRLAPADRNVLPELGMDASYEKWIGTQAFGPNSPLPDPDWSRTFLSQVSFGEVAMLYVRHPGVALRELNRELNDSVHANRPDYMANYRREDGFPPHSVATRFSFWSSLRARLLTDAPWHLPVIFALPLVLAGVRLARPRKGARSLLPLALTLVAAGSGEFAVCTLADAIDTHRHLFLFHVITEAVILLLLAWVLSIRSAPTPQPVVGRAELT